jgi:Putative transposase, YhgA-like
MSDKKRDSKPHDKFFRKAMSEMQVAQSFLKKHLPPAIEKVAQSMRRL